MPHEIADYQALQTRFAAALSDRDSVKEAIAQFIGDAEPVERRLALYRGNVLVARSKALRAAYPVVAKIVGEEFFSALARAYMNAHPSTSGDLNGFGGELASFITDFERTAELPYLGEVARLEWLIHSAHYAADRDPLALERLAAIPAEQQVHATFVFHPAVALLQSDYPLARIWEVHQDDYRGQFEVAFNEGPYFAVVQRPVWRVEIRGIDAAAFAFLATLQQGEPLGAAVEAALAQDAEFDLGRALLSALENHLIVDCSIAGEAP